MCGIAGWGAAAPLDEGPARLHEMCERLAHRGPDDRGSEMFAADGDGQVALGMRRLAIVDLDGGHQPITGEDGRVTVVCNGEIYNHAALRSDLERAGHSFRSRSDVEVVVHLYEEYGIDAIARLRGMFALAIWDGDRLVLARDRLGIKPLYLRRIDSLTGGPTAGRASLGFASEAKALAPLAPLKPAGESLSTYLARGYLPAPMTPFEGVEKLPAGHLAIWDGTGVSIERWWSLNLSAEAPSNPEMVTLAALEDAVSSHLMADVPVGAFLSGGLDSSVVAALMARESASTVKTFTVGFAGDAGTLDERKAALEVARHIGSDHTEIVIETAPTAVIDAVAWAYDEPVGDEAALPTFLMAEAAAEHVKVVLTGEGADEVFGGYRKYQMILAARRLAGAPAPVKKTGIRALAAFAGERRASKIAAMLDGRAGEASLAFDEVFTARERSELLAPDLDTAPFEPLPTIGSEEADALTEMLAIDIGGFLADGLLHKVDRTTMAHSLEARVPYLDHSLVEIVASIPHSQKVRLGTGKRLLRTIGADLLPGDIHQRRKHGFTVPLDSWLRNTLAARVDELLAADRLSAQGLWNVSAVADLVRRHRGGDTSLARRVWLLVAWQLWHHAFFESGGRGAKL